MNAHMVTGDGGTKLHVQETGKRSGKPILFIHGFSQCSLAWSKQLNSDLADSFRLLALDLRGHGLSDKPRVRTATLRFGPTTFTQSSSSST